MHRRMRRSIRAAGIICLLGLLAAALLVGAGCGGGEPAPDDGAVLTVEEALAVEPGELVKVQGAVVATATQTVLASALLESYPPQAGGAILPVTGLDLESLVGLSSTTDRPELNQVTWSDYWAVLGGVISNGELEVRKTPQVVETTSNGMRVRFSPVTEPLRAGDNLWWAFDVKNLEAMTLDLVFSSGQRANVVLAQGGVEKYRWSEGKAFDQAIETVTLEPSQTLSIVLNDLMSVEPGDYELTAMVTAAVGPAGGPGSPGSGIPLAELKTTITVR